MERAWALTSARSGGGSPLRPSIASGAEPLLFRRAQTGLFVSCDEHSTDVSVQKQYGVVNECQYVLVLVYLND